MKLCCSLLVMFMLAATTIGCGGSAGQPNPAAEAEAEKLNSDPSYEEQMMGGGQKAEN